MVYFFWAYGAIIVQLDWWVGGGSWSVTRCTGLIEYCIVGILKQIRMGKIRFNSTSRGIQEEREGLL